MGVKQVSIPLTPKVKNPLVSIILPVFNEERTLFSCLLSLFNQTHKNIEIIVVDDGSVDKSVKIISGFKVNLIKQKHKGAGAARNNGARKAKGEILVFLDSDMKYDSYYIEKLIQPILIGKTIGTFNKIEKVANPANIWSRCWSVNSDLPDSLHAPRNLPDTQNIFRAILKKEFQRVGGFDEGGYTDDITLSKKLKKQSVAAAGAISYHYNPETLRDVFYSARWIGRSGIFFPDIVNLLRFSPVNSLRISAKKVIKGAPMHFFVFKLIYDLGIFVGIFLNFSRTQYK